MPKYPSTSLVTLAEKLAKIDDLQVRKDIETEIRKADLDLLAKINEVSGASSVQTFTLPPSATTYTIGKEYPYTPTFTGFGTPTAVNFTWTRVGNRIKVMGKFTCGTNTATEARISLPGSLVSDAALVTTIQVAGIFVRNVVGATSDYCLIESGVGYITIGLQDAARGGLTKQNGNIIGNNEVVSVQFELPVSGWNV